jgi:WD40 repeat protein
MHHVFISYSRKDAAVVDEVLARLQSARIPHWVDRRDLPLSLPWLEDVRYAISGAILLAACRSPAFEVSEPCAREIEIAREQGVPICDLELADGVEKVMDKLGAIYRREAEAGRARAEITRRAADWVRSDRSTRLLASGRFLRSSRSALRGRDQQLPEHVATFIAASRRRDRRRRTIAALGAAIIAVSYLGTRLFKEVQERGNKDASELATSLATARFDSELLARDPYAGLDVAAKEARNAPPDSFLKRDRLMRALAVPVPDRSRKTTAVPPALSRAMCRPAEARNGCRSQPVRGLVATAVPQDGVVEIRSTRGALLRRISTGEQPTALALSPDGRALAVGGRNEVALYSSTSGTLVTRLRGAPDAARAIVWSADGRAITALMGDRVTHWRWRPGRTLLNRPHAWFVAMSGVRADGAVTAVQRDGTLTTFQTSGAPKPHDVATGLHDAFAADFAPDGSAAVIAQPTAVTLVALPSGRTIGRTRKPGCSPAGVAFATDAKSVWVACASAPVRQLAVPTLELLSQADAGPLGSVKVIPDRDGLYIAQVGSAVSLTAPGRSVGQLYFKPCGRFRALTLDPRHTRMLVVGDGAGKLTCSALGTRISAGRWHFNGLLLPRRPGQQSRAASFSPDGAVAAVGYSDGTVATFTVPEQTPGWLWPGVGGSIRALRFTRDGREVITASREGMIEATPACPLCNDRQALTQLALDRVSHAARLGLAVPSQGQSPVPPP